MKYIYHTAIRNMVFICLVTATCILSSGCASIPFMAAASIAGNVAAANAYGKMARRQASKETYDYTENYSGQHDKVIIAQTKLNALGYGAGAADGKVGKRTFRALRKYQRDQGIAPTGQLNKKTFDSLTGSGGCFFLNPFC